MVSLTVIPQATSNSHASLRLGNRLVPGTFFLTLLLALAAIAADQFVAPALYSSSPLWATTACLLLVWRRRDPLSSALDPVAGLGGMRLSTARIAMFCGAHAALVLTALGTQSAIQPVSGTSTTGGWIVAALKLSVLAPTFLLLPSAEWRVFWRVYKAEALAAIVVLLTFFPSRVINSIWPWYGQALGKFVFFLSQTVVPSLAYRSSLTPTLAGPHLDVTILLACSGIDGVKLFDCLFAFVVFLDWNRLRKGRALLAYFAGIAVIIFGNALRITSFVVLGNNGFAEFVARHHLSAGSIFFNLVFLAYLSLIYRHLLSSALAEPPTSSGAWMGQRGQSDSSL
jgi:exosortase/archaeosortase family protein